MLRVYFQDRSNQVAGTVDVDQGLPEFTFTLPVGEYVAYAWTHDFARGSAYSEAVACGLGPDCTDHALRWFSVESGSITTEVDICDWVVDPSSLPRPD